MATRLNLPHPVGVGAPPVAPAFDVGWEWTDFAVRASIGSRRYNTPRATHQGMHENTATGTQDVLGIQYVSEPIGAQTLGGTVRGIIPARESNVAAEARAQMIVRVVSGDGTTFRGTLLPLDTGALTNELTTSSPVVNVKYPRGHTNIALTPIVCREGDRLVIEIGFRAHNTATSDYGYLVQVGDDVDLPDCGEDEAGTTGSAWIEFSQTLLWAPDYTVTSLTAGSSYTGGLKQAILDARAANADVLYLSAGAYTYGTVTNDTAGTKMLRVMPEPGLVSSVVVIDDGVRAQPQGNRYLSFENVSFRRGVTITNTYRYQMIGCPILAIQFETGTRRTTIEGCEIGGYYDPSASGYSNSYGILLSLDAPERAEDVWILGNELHHIDSKDACEVRLFTNLVFDDNYVHDLVRVIDAGAHTDAFRTFLGGTGLKFRGNLIGYNTDGQGFFINGGAVNGLVDVENNLFGLCVGSFRTFAVDDNTERLYLVNNSFADGGSFGNSSAHKCVVAFNNASRVGVSGFSISGGATVTWGYRDYNIFGSTPAGITPTGTETTSGVAFTDYTLDDFSLASGSAGMDYGIESGFGRLAPGSDRQKKARTFPCEAGAIEGTPVVISAGIAYPAPTPTGGYFASPFGTGGAAGTEAAPLTLTAAISKAITNGPAGKVITLLAGTYNESSKRAFANTFEGSSGGGRVCIRGGWNGDAIIRYNQGIDGEAMWSFPEGLGWTGNHHIELNSLHFDGVSRSGPNIEMLKGTHHFVVANCRFISGGRAHIAAHGSDYTHVDRCLFSTGGRDLGNVNNPSACTYHYGGGGGGTSGSIDWCMFDQYTGFHNVFSNNIITGQNDPVASPTDGNGFILDNIQEYGSGTGDQPQGNLSPLLVVNNLVYQVGGRGLHIYGGHGGPFFLVNNTVYKVGCDTDNPGQKGSFTLQNGTGDQIYWINNISYAFTGKYHFTMQGSAADDPNVVEMHTNIVRSATGAPNYVNLPTGWSSDTSMIVNADPLFTGTVPIASATTAANQHLGTLTQPWNIGSVFTLQAGSPGVNAGVDPRDYMLNANQIADYERFGLLDLAGNPRPVATVFDIGAYER